MTGFWLDDLWAWALASAGILGLAELLVLERQRRTFIAETHPLSAVKWWALWKSRPASNAAASTPKTGVPARARKRRQHAVHRILDTMTDKQPASARSSVPAPEPRESSIAVLLDRPVVAPQPPAASPPAEPPPTAAVISGPAVANHRHEVVPAQPLAPTRGADGDVGIVYVDLAGRFTFATQVARDLLAWQSGELILADILADGGVESGALLKLVAQQEVLDRPVMVLVGGQPLRFQISALALRDRTGNMWGAALFLRRPVAPDAGTTRR